MSQASKLNWRNENGNSANKSSNENELAALDKKYVISEKDDVVTVGAADIVEYFGESNDICERLAALKN